jgi:tetratricopeptide (TPR) repeat protein
MPEDTNAGGDHSSETNAEASKAGVERRSGQYVSLLLGCVVVALTVVIAVIIFNPPEEAGQEPANAASTVAPAPDQAAVPGEPRGVPRSTIQLASVAYSATPEQIQDEAERVANALRELYPDLAQALHVVAMFESQIRHSGEAERLWRKCIEIDPKQVAYYVNLAAIAMDRGNSQLAAETLEQAVAAGCITPDVYHHLAVALTKLGRSEEAEEVIRKALSVHGEVSAYWFVLGQAQLKSGKAADAEASLRKAIALGSESASVYFSLGNACARQGKQEEAAAFRERFTELKAEKPMDKQQRFQVLSTAESRRTAVTILCEAAAVHRQQQNTLESERLLHRAIVLDPGSVAPCRLLVEIYMQAGMLAEARVVLRRLNEIEPSNLVNYFLLAQICVQLGEPESAEAALKLAIAMMPEAVEGYATLAQFYLQTQKAGEARWSAQEAIRRQPSAEAYEFLASTCRMMGDAAGAEAALAKARQLAPASSQQPAPPVGR